MMRIIAFLFLLSLQIVTTNKLDSLLKVLPTQKGRERFMTLLEVADQENSLTSTEIIKYGYDAYVEAKKLNDHNIGYAYIKIANGYELAGTYNLALKYLLKADSIFMKFKISKNRAYISDRIGFLYYEIGDFKKAEKYISSALNNGEKISLYNTVYFLNHLGLVKDLLGKHFVAEKIYFKAIDLAVRNSFNQILSALYHNVALLNLHTENYKKAERFYLKAVELEKLDKEFPNTIDYAITLINLGALYLKTNELYKANYSLDKAFKIVKNKSTPLYLRDIYFNKYKYYKKIGNNKKALKYCELYKSIEDEVFNSETKSKMEAELTAKLIEQKEAQYKLLEAKSLLKEEKLKTQKILLIVLVIVSGVLFVLYTQIKLKKSAYIELVKKDLNLVKFEKLYSKDIFSKTGRENKLNSELVNTTSDKLSSNKLSSSKLNSKYSRSSLTNEQKKEIKFLILNSMENEKSYLENDLTINKLSRKLNISRTYISQVINEVFNKSFIQFVNEYRVKEARHLLSSEEGKLYTVDYIAKKSGFNSATVFSSAFKKFTGVTPSFYLKSLKK